MIDIKNALRCGNTDLKNTFKNYFKAIGESYFDKAYNELPGIIKNNIKVSIKNCGINAVVDQIYSTIDSATQLVNLIQETSKAIAVIHKVCILLDRHFNNREVGRRVVATSTFKLFRLKEHCITNFYKIKNTKSVFVIANVLLYFMIKHTYVCKCIFDSCNIGTSDLPDIYAQSSRAAGPRAEGIHIRQITSAYVTTIM